MTTVLVFAFFGLAALGRRAGLAGILCRCVVMLLWPVVAGALWFGWLIIRRRRNDRE